MSTGAIVAASALASSRSADPGPAISSGIRSSIALNELLIAPLEWEEHQQPHDYFRYTRYGLEHLLRCAGFTSIEITPVGGIFRLVGRRLLNAIQFLPLILKIILFLPLAVPGVLMPLLDPLDTRRNFTLGYICSARKES